MFKKRNIFEIVIPAIGLLAICGLSYGFTAGKLGFALDDWYIIWTYRTFGAAKYVAFFQGDRPLFSFIYRIFIPIIKDSPLSWQLFAIFTKWLASLTLWALLRMLLPKKKWFAYAVAALFAVYTGFKFHYFAVMYAQNYAIFAIYFLSYIFMILAVRNPKQRWLFTGLGLSCQFIGIAPMELYYGLELVRPIVLFLIVPEEVTTFKARLLAAAKLWLPYFILLLGFTLFRVFFSGRLYSYQIGFMDQFLSAPLQTIKLFVRRIIRGWYDSSVNVWLQLVNALTTGGSSSAVILRAILMAASFLVALFVLLGIGKRKQDEDSKKQSLWLIGIGTFAVLVGMIPVVIADLDVNLSFHNNRFLLPLSIGSCLVLVALVDMIFRNQKLKTVIVALLVALSVGVNHLNGLEFQKAWEDQKDFFAQLTWRAPQIEPGTVIITTDLPFSLYYSGTSLTAPLNLIYAPDLDDNPVPYQFILAASPQMNSMPALLPDQAIDRTSRVFTFIGSTSDMLTVYKPEEGCLKVIDSDTDPDSFKSDEYADLWAELIPLSDLTRINTAATAAELPARYFREVSTETWCYYYQKAALAEQQNQWSDVLAAYAQADEDGFQPEHPSEWLPLIAAHIELGDFSSALTVSEDLTADDEFTLNGLCSLWQNSKQPSSETDSARLEELFERWGCTKK